MHWHIIRWLRDHTVARWYDLGGTDGFQGLHQFKKGMVGARGLIRPVPPVANYAARLWPRLIGEGAFAGRELLHRVNRWIDRLAAGSGQARSAPAGMMGLRQRLLSQSRLLFAARLFGAGRDLSRPGRHRALLGRRSSWASILSSSPA